MTTPNINKDERVIFLNADPEDCLIFAGPGTGKTTCLLTKMTKLIQDGKYEPSDMIFLTFTRYAREDLVRKLKEDERYKEIRSIADEVGKNILTYASFIGQIFDAACDLDQNDEIFSGTFEGEQDVYTRLLYKRKHKAELASDHPHHFHLGARFPDYIETDKNDPFLINDHIRLPWEHRRNKYSLIPCCSKIRYYRDLICGKAIELSSNKGFYKYLERLKGSVPADTPESIYEEYDSELKNAGRIDTIDISLIVLRELKRLAKETKPDLPGILRPRQLIMVDEMQDQNPVDLELLTTIWKLWRAKLTMVGDLNQTIYFFRLANPINLFKPPFDRFKRYHLLENHRSTKAIIEHVNEYLPIAKRGEGTMVSSLIKWDSIFDNPLSDISDKDIAEFRLSIYPGKKESKGEFNPCLYCKDIYEKIEELINRGVTSIGLLAVSKKENGNLYKQFGRLSKKWSDDRLRCYYPNLLVALYYTKFYLLHQYCPVIT